MPFKYVDVDGKTVGYFLTIAFFSSICIGGRTNIILLASISLSFALSVVGDWPFDDERWSMAIILFFATPIGLAIERLSVHHRMAAGVVLLGFFLIQIPARAHPNGMAFYNEAYQYSRLHRSTSTEEALRWLDERISGDNTFVLADATSMRGLEYYVFNSGLPNFDNLERAQRVMIATSERIDDRLAELGGSTFALLHFHQVGRISAQVHTIEEECDVIDHLKPNDRLRDDHRVMRAEVVIFRCD